MRVSDSLHISCLSQVWCLSGLTVAGTDGGIRSRTHNEWIGTLVISDSMMQLYKSKLKAGTFGLQIVINVNFFTTYPLFSQADELKLLHSSCINNEVLMSFQVPVLCLNIHEIVHRRTQPVASMATLVVTDGTWASSVFSVVSLQSE